MGKDFTEFSVFGSKPATNTLHLTDRILDFHEDARKN